MDFQNAKLAALLSRRRWEGRLMSDPRVAGEASVS